MLKNRYILFTTFLIALIWISFYFFEDYLNFTYKNNSKIYNLDTQVIYKYDKLSQLLNIKNPKLNLEIFEKLLSYKPKTIPLIKHKQNSKITLNLRYIIITPTKKVAFINNKLVKVGDYISKFQIVDIRKDCVIIRYKRKLKCLKLK